MLKKLAILKNTAKVYLSLPEMRLFWIFLFLAAVMLAVDVFGIGGSVEVPIKAALFLVLGSVIFVANLRLARSNLEVKIERNQLSSVVTNLKDGIVAYDPNFKILMFNPAAEEIFGVRVADVLGQYFDTGRVQAAAFRRMAQTMFPSLAPMVIPRSEPGAYPQISDLSFDNPYQELRVTTVRIADAAGKLLGFLKIVRDRTREKNILKSKSEFITVAAHQLRTPLTGIEWMLEELNKDAALPENLKSLVTNGLSAGRRLTAMVNDLLDVSKIEEGRFGYQFDNVEIISFVEQALSGAAALAQEYGIKIYFDKPAEPSIVLRIDQQKIGMVLSNLLDNAIKYNIKNGEVTVKIERLADKPFVQVSVKDTGAGISSDDMKKLFTKFFRAEAVVRAETAGSGFGLYIAKNVILRHGGVIWAESEPGRGSVFYFTLPTDPRLIPPREIVYEEE